MKPRLYVEQKITAFVNRYKVYDATESGTKAQLVALAQQKRLAFKEKVSFYTDESKQTLSYSFRAEKVLDVHGRYIVEDAAGTCVGMFKKEFGQSFIKSTWKILDQQGTELYTVTENSTALALFRRYGGIIPVVGDLIDIICLFLKYHFEFIDSQSGAVVGKYQKTTLLRDHYLLSMTDDAYASAEPRTLGSMCVALDALQSR